MSEDNLKIKVDYEWNNLDDKWNTKLMSKNFVTKDCLGDGNCQFRSIETALNDSGIKMDHNRLRDIVAKYIRKLPDEEFNIIVESYIIEKQNGEFIGKWDPELIRTKKDLIFQIKKPGFHFEGDNITLSLLSKGLNIDFIIFDENYNVIDMSNNQNYNNKIVILYYIRNENYGHYMTVGFKNKKKVVTIFKRDKLPSELELILNKQKFLIKHIINIINEYEKKNKKPTLNNILSELEYRICFKLGKIDKHKLIKLLGEHIKSNENILQMNNKF